MPDSSGFSDGHFSELARMLRSRLVWVRHPAVEELAGIDFEQIERPPQLRLLLAAMNAPELRDKARDSLTRVLSGIIAEDLKQIGFGERQMLRAAVKTSSPLLHPDFLIAVSHTFDRLGDTEAIPTLEHLVDRSTIAKPVQRTPLPWTVGVYAPPEPAEPSEAEKTEMRRVRSAAHVACERLRLLAETPTPGGALLHPASAPEPDELLRPAGNPATDSSLLLRLPHHHDEQ